MGRRRVRERGGPLFLLGPLAPILVADVGIRTPRSHRQLVSGSARLEAGVMMVEWTQGGRQLRQEVPVQQVHWRPLLSAQ